MISASAEEVYPDEMEETEQIVDIVPETEQETELKMESDAALYPDLEKTVPETENQGQPLETFDNSISGIALYSGDLQVCLGYPDNRYLPEQQAERVVFTGRLPVLQKILIHRVTGGGLWRDGMILMALHVTLMPMVRRIMVLHLPVLSLPNIILPTPMYSLTAHSIKN